MVLTQRIVSTIKRPFNRAGLLILILTTQFLVPPSLLAQWRLMLPTHTQIRAIYFINLPGPPRIGFAAGVSYPELIYKTTNGGGTWETVPFGGYGILDMTFKDSLTGWATVYSVSQSGQGCYKTTDGGDSWFPLPGSAGRAATAIFYNKDNGGLFLSAWSGIFNLVSWDEGATWANSWPTELTNGLAFNDDSLGVAATAGAGNYPWYRTTDGGKTWALLGFREECWQPLGIDGTNTFFAISDWSQTIYRTDDAGNNWKGLYTFPDNPVNFADQIPTTGCIRGDSIHLFVQEGSGCYLSTDQGSSWKYLCGLPSYGVADTRFFVKYPYVYIATNDRILPTQSLWMLNVDSMQYFPTGISFTDGTKRTSVRAGSVVTVNYSPQTSDPIGIDTGHLVFHYDTNALELKDIRLPPSWIILDSSTTGGVLDLRIVDTTGSQLPTPAVQLIFNTYLSPSESRAGRSIVGDASSPRAFVYLDSADLSGHRLNCDCQALSIIGPDSVEIDFTGCGDSTILAAMGHEPPFTIKRVSPNPSEGSFTIEYHVAAEGPLSMELEDYLGRMVTVLKQGWSKPGDETETYSVQNISSGLYRLVLRSGARELSRLVVIAK